jgi:hypothetical protein
MNSPILAAIIVVVLIVGSTLTVMNKACDTDLFGGRVQG